MSRGRAPKDWGFWVCFLGKGGDLDTLRLQTLKCFPEVVMIGISLALAEPTKIKNWRCKEWGMQGRPKS